MAKSFLSKFNTLLQANVRNVVGSGRRVKSWQLGNDLNEEIARLREQFQAAEQDQVEIEQRIAALNEKILKWDTQADDALRAGREAEARHAIEYMERARRQVTMMQSERDDHQRAMGQLLAQINQLEALAQTATQEPDAHPQNDETRQSLSEAIRQARKEANATSENTIRVEVENEAQEEDNVEQELAARRARLAKPD